MLVPPGKLGLHHLDAHAVADAFGLDLDRRRGVRQAEHVDGEPRRHEIVGAVALLDHMGEQADNDTAVQGIGVPRAVRNGRGHEGSWTRSWVKKGWFFVMARDHGGFRCVKSSTVSALMVRRRERRLSNRVARTGGLILRDALRAPQDEGLAAAPPSRHSSRTLSSGSLPVAFAASASPLPPDQLRQRPCRCAADQRACIIQPDVPPAASDASSALAIAISTLRIKRSRPMRLTGDFENSARTQCRRAVPARPAKAHAIPRVRRALLRGLLRELVPRAHGETVVAAIDAVADGFAEFVRDWALVLDGQIRNAAPRIELVGRGEGRGRADLLAGIAGAAMIGVGVVARQVGCRKDRAEKQLRPNSRETRLCACPASPVPPPAPAASPSPLRYR